MDAGAAAGGVQGEADGGAGVVGDFGALVGGEESGGIGGAGGDNGEVSGGEQGAEAVGEGQGDVFFEEIVAEMGSGVGAAVGGVEQDEGAGGRGWGGFGLRGEGDHQRGLWSLRLGGGLRGGQGREAAEDEQDDGDELLPGRSQWARCGNWLIVIGWDEGIMGGAG